VTRRFDLTDSQWAVLEPLLPKGKKPGRPPKWTRRQLIDGIRWRVRTGTPWRDVPDCYGHWRTVYGLYRRWQRNGTWARILSGLQTRADAAGLIGWDVSVDSTIVRAHQHAGGARREPDTQVQPPGELGEEPDDHGLGRSRGGLSTKLHLACEQGRKVLSLVLTGGQRGDSPQFSPPCWNASGYPGPVWGVHGYARCGCWRTRRTAAAATGRGCVGVESGAPSRSRRTRLPTAGRRGQPAVASRPSTRRSTSAVTRWSAASISSSSTALWPPGTRNWPCATRPPSPSA